MLSWFSLFKRDHPKAAEGICKKCGSPSLKRRKATDPVHLTGKLAGKRIDVYRVKLDRCRKCGHLMPTTEGRAKVKR